jgi:hypothetical protein
MGRAGKVKQGRAIERGRHRWRGWLRMLPIVLLLGGALLLAGTDPLDRLLHPQRFAVSGTRLVAMDAYPTAARQALAAGERIGGLMLPGGRGPVVVLAGRAVAGEVAVYLDPPTARVLDMVVQGKTAGGWGWRMLSSGMGRAVMGAVALLVLVMVVTGSAVDSRRGRWDRAIGWGTALPLAGLASAGLWMAVFPVSVERSGGGRPLERVGQPVGVVVAHAAVLAGGARLLAIDWPTARVPDWTLRYAGGLSVKVADDRPGATAARGRGMGAIVDPSGRGWGLVVLVMAGVAVLGLVVTGVRRRRGS